MKNWLLSMVLCSMFFGVSAQFTDRFSDGNFSENPVWMGDTAHFEISDSLRLHLNAPSVAAESYLVTASKAIRNSSWECRVQLDFNPSSANKCRFVLVSNQANINQDFQGYYVEIGNTSDDISLYRRDDQTAVKIIDGPDGMLNTSSIDVQVKATCDSLGNWKLYADSTGNEKYRKLGTANDLTYKSSQFTGLWCDYSSTRSTKFWFDNVVVTGDTFPDETPPAFVSQQLFGDSLWKLTYSEKLAPTAIINIYPPIDTTIQYLENELHIRFPTTLQNAIPYQISIHQLSDYAGNVAADTIFNIQYLVYDSATYRDVVFNEILPDPSPANTLPEHEYIELYNVSNKVLSLKNWKLVNSEQERLLPDFTLLPKAYVLLCSNTAAEDLKQYGAVIGLSNWVALTNSADDLQLKNASGLLLDELSYSDTWYGDDVKKDGGWSLEQIDPTSVCSSSGYWRAAITLNQGTPGQLNSVLNIGFDTIAPALANPLVVTENQIVFPLSEKLHKDVPIVVSSNPPILDVSALYLTEEQTLDVSFTSLIPKTRYEFSFQLTDCSQNHGLVISQAIYLPEPSIQHDVVINEILYNPYPNGVDFVEILNVSDKYISLQNWTLASNRLGVITYASPFSDQYFLLKPHEYLTLCTAPEQVSSFYAMGKQFLTLATMPSMNDNEGNILLLNADSIPIDQLTYSDKDQLDAINNTEGISLERINPHVFGNTTSHNWHSAASSVGYATPGYENSQHQEQHEVSSSFSLANHRMSPNNDGIDDVLEIHLNTSPGVGTIKIFNLSGLLIGQLNNIVVLGTSNIFYWDGITIEGELVPVGNYLIVVELTLETGILKRFKDAFAVVWNP